MQGRGHQHAWRGDSRQCLANVGRVKRLRVAECVAAAPCHQHRGFKPVHVLRRYRANQGAVRIMQYPQTHCLGLYAADQCAPGFGMRLRGTGRARSEYHRDALAAIDLRNRNCVRLAANAHGRVAQLRQIHRAHVAIGQTKHIRCKDLDLAHRFRCVRRRQQADFAGHNRRRQTHAKTVTVAAHIEQMTPCGKQGGKLPDLGQELAQRDRTLGAPGDDAVRGGVRYQWQRRHV